MIFQIKRNFMKLKVVRRQQAWNIRGMVRCNFLFAFPLARPDSLLRLKPIKYGAKSVTQILIKFPQGGDVWRNTQPASNHLRDITSLGLSRQHI